MSVISHLTDPKAVRRALRECDRLGRDAFLAQYGYKRARRFYLRDQGREYDSKAIAGVAYGYQHRQQALTPYDFSGGENTVWRVLTKLGFEVEGAKRLALPSTVLAPTSDYDELYARAAAVLRAAAKARTAPPVPPGNPNPRRGRGSSGGFFRHPGVVAFVLGRAGGYCEACGSPAPFARTSGLPFLEVHHVVMLAHGGPDTADNAAALCPNCHRAMHCAGDKAKRTAALYRGLPALKKYPFRR